MSELNGTGIHGDGDGATPLEKRKADVRSRTKKVRTAYLQYRSFIQSCSSAGLTPESLLLEKDREAWDLVRDLVQNGHLLTPESVQAAIDTGATLDAKYEQLALMLEEVIRGRLTEALVNPQAMRPIEYRGVAAALLATLQLRRSCQQAPGSVPRPVEALLSSLPELLGPIDADSLDAPQAPPDPTTK